jgi:hypothetical protein
MASERIEVQRLIEADPVSIFRVLCDPQGHVAIDSSGMLQSADGDPVAAVGDGFVVHMDREALNGCMSRDSRYRVESSTRGRTSVAANLPGGTVAAHGGDVSRSRTGDAPPFEP